MTDVEKLVILGKLESHISYLSRRTHVDNLQLGYEDLVQEGRTKVLTIINDMGDVNIRELIAQCFVSLNNFYSALIRKSRYGKYSTTLVDLDEAFGLSDKNQLNDIYFNLQFNQLYELFDADEAKVMQCLMEPPIELVKMAQEKHTRRWSNAEVKITREMLATFLGYSKTELRNIIDSMRTKAMPILETVR